MMKLSIRTSLLLCALLYPISSVYSLQTAPSTFIQGHLCSQAQNGLPAPGLLISLVHPELGRSAPVFTDRHGNFTMANIPIMENPYYIEIYWGQRLIYRNSVYIPGPVQLPDLCL
ncbi:MAG TPA: hypothetical protein DCZ03_14870 [Gammaproteobacteria bacterium]|nr:hypothetical protein [Gammaproteobacteria bacterium]